MGRKRQHERDGEADGRWSAWAVEVSEETISPAQSGTRRASADEKRASGSRSQSRAAFARPNLALYTTPQSTTCVNAPGPRRVQGAKAKAGGGRRPTVAKRARGGNIRSIIRPSLAKHTR